MKNITGGHSSRTLGLLTTIVAALGACAGSQSTQATPSPDTMTDAEDIIIAVTNNTLARLRVHARYAESDPVRLGEVSVNRTRVFQIPWQEQTLRIGVRRADATVTDPRWSRNALTVARGDSLEFTLTANARRTAQVVFRKVGKRGGL